MRFTEPNDYVFKTQPYDHQREAFLLSREREYFALLMEMGTGKSKVIIDNAAWLFGRGLIKCLIVIAPNGVHRNWTRKEVPAHLPDHIDRVVAYYTASPKKHEKLAFERVFEADANTMRIVAFNIEAMSTDKGVNALRRVQRFFKSMLVIDESSRIKSPGRRRTRALVNLGQASHYRRILTGTAITQGPLDAYTQYKFLDPYILKYTTFTAYKAHYAEYERRKVSNRRGFYDHLIAYKNLDELSRRIAPHSYRVLKKDCLDLPQKVYERYAVELSANQRRLYKEMRDNVLVTLREQAATIAPLDFEQTAEEELMHYLMGDDVPKVKIKNALTRLLRMQQVIGGFFTDEDGETHAVDKTNKRIEALMSIVEETQSSVIIWARFTAEIRTISAALREVYGDASVVEYHGAIDSDEREVAEDRFQAKDARFFIGQPHSGGIGLTLTAAQTVVYFSNDFSLETRLQSEDRAHRIGQRNNVTYVDIIASGTIDEHILDALSKKQRIADEIYAGMALAS